VISALRSTHSAQNAKTRVLVHSVDALWVAVTTLVASASFDGRDAVFTAVCLFVSRITQKN